ncbi:hypothetical protein HDF16_002777 [Granulicella aggregans]|uniref:Uncharacterized protein n=1 Tax=Granulicella aggregans TaxID=474949 RepID=A0A7W7ZDT5_9BACT|nr:hypothetical protein [Granulicella aggregans]
MKALSLRFDSKRYSNQWVGADLINRSPEGKKLTCRNKHASLLEEIPWETSSAEYRRNGNAQFLKLYSKTSWHPEVFEHDRLLR